MLSENIKKARNDRHLSQRALADIIGVSQQTVGSWEVGRTSPDNEMLKKLASFFNVSVDYLLGRTDEPGDATGATMEKDPLTALDRYRQENLAILKRRHEPGFDIMKAFEELEERHKNDPKFYAKADERNLPSLEPLSFDEHSLLLKLRGLDEEKRQRVFQYARELYILHCLGPSQKT